MAKVDELIAERKRVEEIERNKPKMPVFYDTSGVRRFCVEPCGGISYEGACLSLEDVHALRDFLNEWYGPTPDAETVRRAACFEELVDELALAAAALRGVAGAMSIRDKPDCAVWNRVRSIETALTNAKGKA